MRVSTGMIFQRGLEALQRQQAAALDTQQHIAAGKRVLRPSDDPVAASRAIETSQAKALNAQYGANQAAARETLALTESVLADIGNVLQDVRVLVLNAGSGALTDADRRSLAIDLRGKYEHLLGLVNSTDGAGNYLFAGYAADKAPFVKSVTGVQYVGDQGNRSLQVGPAQTVAISENGAELFERLREGNGVFVAQADPGNSGTAAADIGRTLGGQTEPVNYSITFSVAGGVTTYTVTNHNTGDVSAPVPYTSGQPIVIDNMEFTISGEPADGDSFTVRPAAQKNVFAMLDELIAALEEPLLDGAARARFGEQMALGLTNVDKAFDRVLVVRTAMGASLRQLEALNETVQDKALHYEERLSQLFDLDYAEAITKLAREQMALEAAQLSYQRITSLSLFNYL